MRVLIVNTNAYSKSTGRIAYLFLNYLRSQGHQAKLCCSGAREEEIEDEDVICLNNKANVWMSALCTRLSGYEGIWNKQAFVKVRSIIESFKPDYVQLYNLHSYYLNHFELLEYLKINKIKTLYTLFDEFAYTGKCGFALNCDKYISMCNDCPQNKKYPASYFFDRTRCMQKRKMNIYNEFDTIRFASTKWTCERAKVSSVLKNRDIYELDEPIDYVNTFYPRETSRIRTEYNIPIDKKIILCVADMGNPRKGGHDFIKIACELEKRDDLFFIIVGYKDIGITLPNNLLKIEYVKSLDRLAEFYSIADLMVCPSMAETTPDACLDSLGCGTPVCGYLATKDVAPIPLCYYTDDGNIEYLKKYIESISKASAEIRNMCIDYAHSRYHPNVVFGKMLNIYKSIK